MLVGGTAMGQVAGSTVVGVTVEEQKVLAVGWSAKKPILGKAVHTSSDEKVGAVDDLIITPDKAVSYAVRDVLWLRRFAVAAALTNIPYFLAQADIL